MENLRNEGLRLFKAVCAQGKLGMGRPDRKWPPVEKSGAKTFVSLGLWR
jgi:hypothetical protein